MPTIILNKKVFEKLVGKKLSEEKLKERISYLGTDLESIEGNEIHVEVFPNRPDMLSEQGFSRAFSTFVGTKKGMAEFKVEKSGEKVVIDKSLKDIRPYTACAIIKNLRFDDEKIREIVQIQEKLHVTYGRNRKKAAIGIYPYERIKPPVYFFAGDPKKVRFIPLESDREMTGLEILSKHPAGREYAHLMEGLDKFAFFRDSEGKILSMTPITNSHDTGKITEETKEVFVECSGFDFDVLSICLNIIVTALSDMGGKIYSMDLEYPDRKLTTPNLSPKKMKLDLDYINRRIGLSIKESEAKRLLERMGYGYEKKNVLVPAYRADILHQADLAEDIAIAYGYENLKEDIPQVSTIGQEDELNVFARKAAEALTGLGLIETNTYNLIDKDVQTGMCNVDMGVVELIDPVSSEYNSLRKWIIPSLLSVLKDNKHNEYPQRIFNIGTIFKKDKKNRTESGVSEAVRLGVMLCSRTAGFTEIKQVLDFLMRMLDIDYSISETEHDSFIPGRVGRVSVKGKDVAYIGEIHPNVLENFDLDMPVSCFELNLSDLHEAIQR
ncbi:phenylalanine--tRNA ligase subunit beta [Candidatus Woesearchaeota archaeon]|nr:phenylalanine--tRNA ligase subunit beta [Candidatus Woesearchaeota archaeon]